MSVHNVWVLPGHILVSVDDGHKIFSFDLLPKPKPWPDVIDFLHTKHSSRKKDHALAVAEVFSVGLAPLFLFLVMKNAEVHIWKFVRPAFEWHFVSKAHLSIGKNLQLMSFCFDAKSKTLFWCERRTTTQCCVCKSTLSMNQKDMIGKMSVILHNCPPVQMSLAGNGSVLLKPTANSPAGLTLFWSAACERIQLHIWNSPTTGALPISSSSDFHSLVRDSISVWINNSANDPVAIAHCSHPVTQELFILESTHSLFSVSMDTDGQPVFKKVCCLDKSRLVELNQRKEYRMLAFQRFIGLFMDDDEFFVFETHQGMLVWSSDSLRNERLRLWVGQGVIPRVGVWNASAVRMLRSDSVVKQAMNMLKFDIRTNEPPKSNQLRISKEYTLQLTMNIDKGKTQTKDQETYVVVDQEDDGTVIREKESANSDSLLLVSEYLREWNSKNYSMEILHWLLASKKLNISAKWLQISSEEDFKKIYRIFNNPCVSLALFYEDPKYKTSVDRIIKDYVTQHEKEAVDDVDPELLSLIKQYCSIVEENELIISSGENESKIAEKQNSEPWSDVLHSLLHNETISKQDFFEIMQWASETKQLEFINEILNIYDIQYDNRESKIEASSTDQTSLSKVILRADTQTFELVCNALWQTYPQMIPEFLRRVSDCATFHHSSSFPRSSSSSSLISERELFNRAIKSLETISWNEKMTKEQVKILAHLHISNEREDIVTALNIYIDNEMYSEAVDLLASNSGDTDVHYQLFYSILTTFIHRNIVGEYSTRLSHHIPSNFRLAEFYHVIKGFEDHNAPCDVFVSSSKEASLSEFKPLLQKLLEAAQTKT
eukprot:gene8977-9935_t